MDELPIVSVDELRAMLDDTQRELEARMEAYDEHTAISIEPFEDGKTTDQRAFEALQRMERFPGEHAAAAKWLKSSPTARIFERIP